MLQFDPQPYLAAFKAKQEQTPTGSQIAQGIGQGINQIGDTYAAEQDKKKQEQRQNLMMALQAGNQGYDPNTWLTTLNGSKSPTQPNPNPPSPILSSPGVNQTLMPQMRPGQGLEASAGTPDTGPQMPGASPMPSQITKSPIIDAWNKSRGQGSPTTPNAPQGQPGPQPMGLFQKPDISGIKFGTPEYYAQSDKAKNSIKDVYEFNQKEDDKKLQRETLSAYQQAMLDAKKGNSGEQDSKEQNRLEQQAMSRISSIRGDTSLKDAESKRDAAITVYNTIKKYRDSGETIPTIVYYDLLGQMWKARSGATPTDQALKDLDQKTFKGNLGKASTFFTGQPAPATTQGVLDSIMKFAADSGDQADQFHESYMKPHLIKPKELADDRWQNVVSSGRGRSFREATGYSDQPKPVYATNGKTRIMSTDGGKTWQPAQ